MATTRQKAPDALVQDVVARIVDVAAPVRIVLFGSAARDEAGAHSDLDVLVVVRPGTHRRRTAQRIYRALLGVGHAVDVIVVTEEDLERHKDNAGMIIGTALGEGRELYAA